jgi:lambda family phage tail tape measure protein
MSQTAELVVKLRQVGGEQLTQLAGKLNNLGKQTAAASTDFRGLAAELKKTQAASTQSINNLKGYANAWREIANSVQIGSREFREANAEAARLEKQLQKTAQAGKGQTARGAAQVVGTALAGGVFGGPEGLIGGIAGGIIGGGPGAATGAFIGASVSQVRQQLAGLSTYAADINRQRQALQLVTKDAGEYQRALAFIDRTSRNFAIPQELITRQFTQLTASVKGAGGNVRDAEKAFTGIAAGIRGTGGSLQQLDSALLATSQVFSKGKVSAEELRQQIGERLPGAFSLFAESMGMTPQQLDKALEKGQVSLLDFQKFAEKLFAEYGENAKIIANGPDAAGDRLRTSLSKLQESVGTLLKPIGAFFQTIFASIVTAIDAATRKLNEFLGLGKSRTQEISDLNNKISIIDKQLQGYYKLRDGGRATGFQESVIKGFEARRIQLIVQRDALKAAQDAVKRGQKEPPSRLPGITSEADETRKTKKDREQEKILRDYNRGLERGADLAEKLRRMIRDVNLETAGIGETAEEAIERKFLEALNDINDKGKDLNKTIKELRQLTGGRVMFEGLVNVQRTGLAQQYLQALGIQAERQRIEALGQLRYEEAFTKAQFGFADTSVFESGIQNYLDGIGRLDDALTSLSEKGFKGVEDSIVELVTTGTFNFRSFAASILADTARMIIQQLVLKTIMQALGFGSPFAKAGLNLTGVGALATAIPGFNLGGASSGITYAANAMGNIFAQNGIQKFARGGIVDRPTMFPFAKGIGLMGEAGPEAIMPLRRGPNGRLGVESVGGGVNVTVNVDANGSNVQGDGPTANQLGRVIGAAVQAEIVKQQRPGGLLSGTR